MYISRADGALVIVANKLIRHGQIRASLKSQNPNGHFHVYVVDCVNDKPQAVSFTVVSALEITTMKFFLNMFIGIYSLTEENENSCSLTSKLGTV